MVQQIKPSITMIAQVSVVLPLAGAGLTVKSGNSLKAVTNNSVNYFVGVDLIFDGRA
jgi:hypothetical protein